MKCEKSQSKDLKEKRGKQCPYTSEKEIKVDVLRADVKGTNADILFTIPRGMPVSVETLSGGLKKISILNALIAITTKVEILPNMRFTLKKNMGREYFKNCENSTTRPKNGLVRRFKKSFSITRKKRMPSKNSVFEAMVDRTTGRRRIRDFRPHSKNRYDDL